MEQEKAIELAKASGFAPVTKIQNVFMCSADEIIRFARLIQSQERECCAKRLEQELYPCPTATSHQDVHNATVKNLAGFLRN